VEKVKVSLGNLILRLIDINALLHIQFVKAKYIIPLRFFQQCNRGKGYIHGLEYIKPRTIHNSYIALHFVCQNLISIWIDRH
jgi:hypothetical protein